MPLYIARLPSRWGLPSRLASSLLALGLTLGAVAPARAAELTLQGPPECRDRDELRFRVEGALGSSLGEMPALELVVTIENTAAGYSGRLVVREPAPSAAPSERKLEGLDCARLLDALSVVIVLAIDRLRTEARAAVERASVTPTARETARSAVAPSLVPPSADVGSAGADDASSASLRPGGLAGFAADIGSLPAPALGIGLGVTLDGQRLRWQASGLLFFEQHVRLEGQGTPAPGADLALALGALSACYAPDGSWQSNAVLGVCVRGEAGRLFGRGTAVQQQRAGGRLWVAPGLNLAGVWQVFSPSVRLAAEAGAVLPLVRSEFRLGALGELYRPSAVSLRAGLGLGIVLE